MKHEVIIEYGKKFGIDLLIETGTFVGDTVALVRDHFADVYSIELSPELYKLAKIRFAGDSKVHLLFGNSEDVLIGLLMTIKRTPLFWLDGHYSGSYAGGVTARGKTDTPISKELDVIFSLCDDSVILIDDARLFDGTNSYPNIVDLEQYVFEKRSNWLFEVSQDIIRLHSKGECNGCHCGI